MSYATSRTGCYTSRIMNKVFLTLLVLGTVVLPRFVFADGTLSESVSTGASRILIEAGLGMPMVAGRVGIGAQVGVVYQIDPALPFYAGLDLGIHRWGLVAIGRDPLAILPRNGLNVVATSIQLLPTFIYRFSLREIPEIIPYLGLSVGPNVYIADSDGPGKPFTQTEILAEIIIRPGINIVATEEIGVTVEPKLGWLRSHFLFSPQVNLSWAM